MVRLPFLSEAPNNTISIHVRFSVIKGKYNLHLKIYCVSANGCTKMMRAVTYELSIFLPADHAITFLKNYFQRDLETFFYGQTKGGENAESSDFDVVGKLVKKFLWFGGRKLRLAYASSTFL